VLNASGACEVLVGLCAVKVVEVHEPLLLVGWLVVTVELVIDGAECPNCRERAWVKDRPVVEVVDLTCSGCPVTVRWCKHRWWCRWKWCRQGSWTHEDPRIAAFRLSVTDGAGRWATAQVGRNGRAVSDVGGELGADWHAIDDAVMAYGQALLDADTDRVGAVAALGVDEVLFARLGRWRTQAWPTSIVDVTRGQLLDVIEGRTKLLGLLEAGDPRGEVRMAWACEPDGAGYLRHRRPRPRRRVRPPCRSRPPRRLVPTPGCVSSAARSCGGPTRSLPDTGPTCRTGPRRRSTT
jgi:hypothetical protein